MKVRVVQTIDATDEYRRAIRHHYGRQGLATREEVREWVIKHGESLDNDIMCEMADDAARGESDG